MKRLLLSLLLLVSASLCAQMRINQKAAAHVYGAPLTTSFANSPATGDVLVAMIGYYAPDNITAPSGWQLIQKQNGIAVGGTTGLASFYHVVSAAEPNSYSFTGIGNSASLTLYDIVGADVYHPINAVASAPQTSITLGITTPAITPSVTGGIALAAVASEATQVLGVLSSGWNYDPSISLSHAIAVANAPPVQTTSPVAASFSLSGIDTYGIATTTILLSPLGTTGHLPTSVPGGPYSGVTNFAISFDGSASVDPRNESLTYSWDFGDGTTGLGPNVSHAYAAIGSFTATLTVTNIDGYSTSSSTSVAIANDCSSVAVGNFGALNKFVPSPTDAWHTDVSLATVDPLSDTILLVSPADLAGSHLHPDFGGNGTYGIPYTVVDGIKGVPLKVTEYPDESDVALYPLPDDLLVESKPSDCSGNGDNHAIVLDKTSCVAYEMYHVQSCSTSAQKWSAGSAAMWDLTQNQHRPYGYTSVDAAGLSVFEGLVRYDEILAGSVNHALRFTANFSRNNANGGYFTAPATHAAGTVWGTDNIMGMRLRLKASYDISNLGPQATIIATAMKKYGMILADNGSNLFFQGTSDPRWDDDDLNGLKSIAASAFEVISAPLSVTYKVGSAPMYPNGPIEDAANHPSGNLPVITHFTASETAVAVGRSVVLTPLTTGSSYAYIDTVGFIRGAVTVTPTVTTTYTLVARNAFGSVSSNVTVQVVPGTVPVLQFTPIPDQTIGAAPFPISASSVSGGAITYTVASGPARLAGNVLTLTGTGTVSLQANQAASGIYLASTATISFEVANNVPNLTFVSVADQTFGAAPFTVSASSLSTGPINYYVIAGPASISGNLVSVTGAGTVTLQAIQAASGNYISATATATFQVAAAKPTLTLGNIGSKVVGDAAFPLSASSQSTGAYSWSVTGPAKLDGNMLTVQSAGLVTVNVSQMATANYLAATASTTFRVQDFQITGPPAITVQAGTPSSTNFTLDSIEGFSGVINMTCLLPSTMVAASCSVANVQMSAGLDQGSSTMTILTTKAPTHSASVAATCRTPLLLLLLLSPVCIVFRRRRFIHLLAPLVAIAVFGSIGCGSSQPLVGQIAATAPGTYQVTITATSGNTIHTMQSSVVVQ